MEPNIVDIFMDMKRRKASLRSRKLDEAAAEPSGVSISLRTLKRGIIKLYVSGKKQNYNKFFFFFRRLILPPAGTVTNLLKA